MSSDSGDGSVNPSFGTGAVNAGHATSGVTAELRNEIQKVVMGIFKEQVPRALKAQLGEVLPEALKATLGSFDLSQQQKPVESTARAGGPDEAQRLSMKALESKINELTQTIQKRDQALAEAEAQRRDALTRSDAHTALAAALGPDNKNLGLVLDSLYGAQKRFVQGQNGETLVKFRSAYGGEDEMLPLKDGVKRLMESELSHLVPNKAANLPTGVRATGQIMGGKPNGAARSNVIDQMLGVAAAQALRNDGGKE